MHRQRIYPCVTGAHTRHASKTQAEACVEDAARLRRLDERDAEESFDAEGALEDVEGDDGDDGC